MVAAAPAANLTGRPPRIRSIPLIPVKPGRGGIYFPDSPQERPQPPESAALTGKARASGIGYPFRPG